MNSISLILHEASVLLRLTGPLVLAHLAQTGMGFVDTVMAGQYASVDLAAVAVGSSIFFPVYLFVLGLQTAVTPLVAQAHGRGDARAVRCAIRQGMVVGLAAGLLLMPLLWSVRPLLVFLGVSAEVIPLAERYLFAISWSLPLGGIFFALRGGGDGLGRPRISMIAGFVGLGVNIAANALLIYGRLGLPVLGGVGCGWATSLSVLAMLGCMALFLRSSRLAGTDRLFALAPIGPRAALLASVRLGLPIGLGLFIECSIFTVIALFIAKLGAGVVAAHQIALNFTSLLYMLPYSLSTALTVRIGFTIGRRRSRRLARIAATGLAMALIGACLSGTLILACSHLIAAMYTQEEAIRRLAATLLGLAAIFQIPDALQVNCVGILRGCKDTRVPLLLMLVAYWGIGLPVGYGLGLARLGGMEPGPQGFWIGLICALTVAAGLLGRRVLVMVRRQAGQGVTAGRP